ncbi:hypothetical protein PRIPAC_98016 [Pristionchus pacificus]|uniref:Uncharacterized protein n=1 Tax=Pristionchus pacificus TaxID=54126 RepID=A0A2A6D1B2_PRIPA|nr:hypothetical protein PRIPAC_98016 [Pristionchus pacificus]|eukprot:PDM84195.1 hypothetical protein PRIPAC_33218 [Pristionchus pacificus]
MKFVFLLCLFGPVAVAFAQDEDLDTTLPAIADDADIGSLAEGDGEIHADGIALSASEGDGVSLDDSIEDIDSNADIGEIEDTKIDEHFHPRVCGCSLHRRRVGCLCAIKKAFHLGFTKGHTLGYERGFDDGKKKGEEIGFGRGKLVGFDEGFKDGRGKGFAEGIVVGHKKGRFEGIAIGKKEGIKIGGEKPILPRSLGWEAGKKKGIHVGYLKGFHAGLRKGKAGCEYKLESLKNKMIHRCYRLSDPHFHPHY